MMIDALVGGSMFSDVLNPDEVEVPHDDITTIYIDQGSLKQHRVSVHRTSVVFNVH